MEKIDILVATYNGEKYLKEQLESLLNQTYKNINIIISDDCSSDGTKEILKEYEIKHQNITVYYQEKNLGYIKNFEFLLKKVESRFFMLCDQDDVWYESKVEESINKLKSSDADLVFTDLEVVDENLNTIYKSFWDYYNYRKKIKKYNDYRLVYMHNVVSGCTILAKASFIKKIIPMPSNSWVIHDYIIVLTVLLNGKVTYIPHPTIKYRQHKSNQVGIKNVYKNFKDFDTFRNFFIQRKIEQFETYVEINDRFPQKLQNQNIGILKYYKSVKDKKCINFKGTSYFFKLYRDDRIGVFLRNYILVNIPILAKLWFYIAKPYKWR